MAYERVKLQCGHSINVNVDGSYRQVKQRLEYMRHETCDQCKAAANRRDGFIALWGSQQDIARAESIRRRTFNQALQLANLASPRDHDAWRALLHLIINQNDAAWWVQAGNHALTMLAQEVDL